MEEKVKRIVQDWIYNKCQIILDLDSLFIVWSCYILGNRKYLVGNTNTRHYFEVTYNKSKDEWYLDVYNKIDHIVI